MVWVHTGKLGVGSLLVCSYCNPGQAYRSPGDLQGEIGHFVIPLLLLVLFFADVIAGMVQPSGVLHEGCMRDWSGGVVLLSC